jgi:hypothetical protein
MKLRALLLMSALAATGIAPAQSPGEGAPPPDRQAAHAAVIKACDAEIKSLCAGQRGRQLMMCLRSNGDQLGGGCKDALSQLRRHEAPPAPPPQ